MAVVSTGLSEAGTRAEFFARFQAVQAIWSELCTRIPTTRDHEHFRFLGAMPQMREWGTGRLAKGLLSESYEVAVGKYECTLEVDRDAIDDDQTGEIRIRIGEMAEVAATHKDYLLEGLLNNGAAAGFLAYDGQPYFSNAHESGQSGAQDNKLTFAAATGTTPTVAEFRAAITQAIATMVAYKDEQGQPLRLSPNPAGFVLVTPPALMFTAMEAVGLPLAPTTDNPVARNIIQNVAAVRTLPGLSSSAMFYLCKNDVTVRPFILLDRMPIEFKALAEGSAEEFKREIYLYGVRGRYQLAYGRWQLCVRTEFT